MLHQITGFNRGRNGGYCGPSALCLITGLQYTEATALLREVSGKPAIKGISHTYMTKAFEKLGFAVRLVECDEDGKRTLARWTAERTPKMLNKTLLLILGTGRKRHYVVLQGRKGGDSFSRGPVWVTDMKHRRRAVVAVYEVKQTNADAIKLVVAEQASERKSARASKSRERAAKSKTLEHAKRLGLTGSCMNDNEYIHFDLPEDKLLDGQDWLSFYSWEEAEYFLARTTADEFEDAEPELDEAA